MKITRFELFIVFIITTLVVALCVFNSIIYYKIFENDEPNPNVSHRAAKFYFGFNVGIGAITFILWCWSIYKMLPERRITYETYY